jgi:hypothetical protein
MLRLLNALPLCVMPWAPLVSTLGECTMLALLDDAGVVPVPAEYDAVPPRSKLERVEWESEGRDGAPTESMEPDGGSKEGAAIVGGRGVAAPVDTGAGGDAAWPGCAAVDETSETPEGETPRLSAEMSMGARKAPSSARSAWLIDTDEERGLGCGTAAAAGAGTARTSSGCDGRMQWTQRRAREQAAAAGAEEEGRDGGKMAGAKAAR